MSKPRGFYFQLALLSALLVTGAYLIYGLLPPLTPADLVVRAMSEESIEGAVLVYGKTSEAPRVLSLGNADSRQPMLLASMSKPITAALIFKLQDRGLLSLDDPLGTFFPEVVFAQDQRYSDITIRQLLNHTSGIRQRTHESPLTKGTADSCRDYAVSQIDAPLHAAPGATYEYANLGFCWLGLIAEAATTKHYESLSKSLLTLGSSFHVPKDITSFSASGGWSATGSDVFAFFRMYSPEATDRVAAESTGRYYSNGWRIDSELVGHTGLLRGISSSFAYKRPDGMLVVVLLNGPMPVAKLLKLRDQLFEML